MPGGGVLKSSAAFFRRTNGELAERAGTSRRLLRYYEEQGLIAPERAASGYRD